MKFIFHFQLCIFILFLSTAKAQTSENIRADGSQRNNIIAATPFLLIVPEARSGAMGNSGVALTESSSAVLNSAALAFLEEKSFGLSLSYSPWLRSYVPDVDLSYLSGFYKVDDRSAIAGSLRYFSLGNIQLTGQDFQELGVSNPNELGIDFSYARNFGPSFALGGTFRFIYSSLANSISSNSYRAGKAAAVDISALYKKETTLFSKDIMWSLGLNLSNIGTKMSYGDGKNAYFLPANFKLGTSAVFADNGNKFIVALDLNKLMVPTQPLYGENGEIIKGMDPDRSVSSATFSSFYDAPGGFTEELEEISISTGLEYIFKDVFTLRAGYNYQNPSKGNARYLTCGGGLKYNVLTLDVAYLASSIKNSPLANTLRFTLQANFGHGKYNPTK